MVSVGGISPYTWSATGLPTGLSINAVSGIISGTPANVVPPNASTATFPVSITVQDSSVTPITGSKNLNLVIKQVPPAAPSNLVATSPAVNQVVLTWTDNANNENGFQVQRATDAAFTTGLWSGTPLIVDLATFTDNNVVSGTTYYYRVRTGNYVAWSTTFSDTVSVTAQ